MVLDMVMNMEGRNKLVNVKEDENYVMENIEGKNIDLEKKIEVEEEVITMEPVDDEEIVKVATESLELEEEVKNVMNFIQQEDQAESPGDQVAKEDETSRDTLEEVSGVEAVRVEGKEEVENEVVLGQEVTQGARWLVEKEMVGVEERRQKGRDEEKRHVEKKKEKKTEKKMKEKKVSDEKVPKTKKEGQGRERKKETESEKKKKEREMRKIQEKLTEKEEGEGGRLRAARRRSRDGGDCSSRS